MRYLQQLRYIDAVARVGSIRRAADTLAITSTALNRRILALEEDLGTPIFERLSQGVRLSVAGELYIQHIRQQLSDMERIRSQIADLAGERRGHVSVVCGQALMLHFLPAMVARYRQDHPGVTFSVFIAGREQAAERLIDYSADVAVIFEPEASRATQTLLEVPQRLHVLMAADHPLASKNELRLSDCVQFPLALPSRRAGIRHMLEVASARRDITLPVIVESDSAHFLLSSLRNEPMLAFQIQLAFSLEGPGEGITTVPLNSQDVPMGKLQVVQLKGRNLPVAAARFAAFVSERLEAGDFGESAHAKSA